MSKINLLISILSILIPVILFFTTYQLSRLRDYNRIQKKNLHRLMYLISIVLLMLNGGFYYSSQQVKNQKTKEIIILNERFENLQTVNNQLLQEKLNLSNDHQELTKENLEISDHASGLSARIQELKSVVSDKDQQIAELKSLLKTHELSAEQIRISN